MVERGEVVMRDQNESSLVEASFHGVVELLAEDTRPIEGIGATVRGIWRTDLDVRRVVGDCKVVREIFGGLCVLLLRKARYGSEWALHAAVRCAVPVEAYGAQVGCRKRNAWWIQYLDFWTITYFQHDVPDSWFALLTYPISTLKLQTILFLSAFATGDMEYDLQSYSPV